MSESEVYEAAERETAERHLGSTGFPPVRVPSVAPDWPVSLDNLAPEDLSELMTVLAGWIAYARAAEARADATVIRAAATIKERAAELTLQLSEKNEKVYRVRAHVELDDVITRWRHIEAEGTARLKLIRGRLEGFMQLYAAGSRELTRRTGPAVIGEGPRRYA